MSSTGMFSDLHNSAFGPVTATASSPSPNQSITRILEIFECGHVRERTDLMHSDMVLDVGSDHPLAPYSPTDAASHPTWRRCAEQAANTKLFTRPMRLADVQRPVEPSLTLYTSGPCALNLCRIMHSGEDSHDGYTLTTVFSAEEEGRAEAFRKATHQAEESFWKARSNFRGIRHVTWGFLRDLRMPEFQSITEGGEIFDTIEFSAQQDRAGGEVLVPSFTAESVVEPLIDGSLETLLCRMEKAVATGVGRAAYDANEKEAEAVVAAMLGRVDKLCRFVGKMQRLQWELTYGELTDWDVRAAQAWKHATSEATEIQSASFPQLTQGPELRAAGWPIVARMARVTDVPQGPTTIAARRHRPQLTVWVVPSQLPEVFQQVLPVLPTVRAGQSPVPESQSEFQSPIPTDHGMEEPGWEHISPYSISTDSSCTGSSSCNCSACDGGSSTDSIEEAECPTPPWVRNPNFVFSFAPRADAVKSKKRKSQASAGAMEYEVGEVSPRTRIYSTKRRRLA